MGVFIQITVAHNDLSSALSQQITEVCPVDIFAIEDGRLLVKPDEEDECTLCALCLRAAPPGTIRIYKTYSGETLVATGNGYE